MIALYGEESKTEQKRTQLAQTLTALPPYCRSNATSYLALLPHYIPTVIDVTLKLREKNKTLSTWNFFGPVFCLQP